MGLSQTLSRTVTNENKFEYEWAYIQFDLLHAHCKWNVYKKCDFILSLRIFFLSKYEKYHQFFDFEANKNMCIVFVLVYAHMYMLRSLLDIKNDLIKFYRIC